jgi:hypothetical protein
VMSSSRSQKMLVDFGDSRWDSQERGELVRKKWAELGQLEGCWKKRAVVLAE